MDKSADLLLRRIQEAIDIVGTQKKLCELSGVNPVILSRLKGYHKGTATLPQKRESLSVKTLQKLASAIGVDVTFFTNEDYIPTKKTLSFLEKKQVSSKDKELTELLAKISEVWNHADDGDRGFIKVKMEQFFYEYDEIMKKRKFREAETA